MKHEWRKHETGLYSPKERPEIVDVPELSFFTISGAGNPNRDLFVEHVSALYSMSYGVRMSYKQDFRPAGYFHYTVYPLEGVWDITDEAKARYTGTLNKDDLVYQLMIRQPPFVDAALAQTIKAHLEKKKPDRWYAHISFDQIAEGPCIQMLHKGSFDDEPKSFGRMEEFAEANGLQRISKIHREIYLTDARKTEPAKLKTILRFKVAPA